MKKFKFIDLFCGLGGFRIAMENNGGQCVFSCDNNLDVCKVYEETDYKTVQGYKDCIKSFLENDKVPANIIRNIANATAMYFITFWADVILYQHLQTNILHLCILYVFRCFVNVFSY